jgi:YVTN family beta-propeller protein
VIEYRTLNVRIEALHQDRYKAIVRGPDGDGQAEFELTFGERDLDVVAAVVSRPRSARRRIESDESAQAREFGERLFDLIFRDTARDVLRAALSQARSENQGLRLMFQLDGARQLRNVPWELLWDSPRFISTSAYTPVLRYVDIPARPPPLSLKAPLRILGMVSSPGDMPPLDAEHEREQLAEACRSLIDMGLLEIDWVAEATLSGLLKRLNQGDYHIFHFIGHGDFDEQAQDGVLLFEGGAGRSHRVTGVDLGTILADQYTLRLAVINACEGARVALDSNGIAVNLMKYGVPAVIAMQFEISDEAAIGFARHFYDSLACSHPIDKALADARRGMFADGHRLEWATPVLFTSVDDGRLFEVGWEDLHRSESGLALTTEPDIAAVSPDEPAGLPVEPTGSKATIVQAGGVQELDGRSIQMQEPDETGRRAERGREGRGSWLPPWVVGAAAAAVVVAIIAVVLVVAGVFSGHSTPSVGAAIPIGRSPVGIVVGQGRVWVTISDYGKVRWIDPHTDKIAGEIAVGGDPNSVGVEPNGYVWVARLKANQVTSLDPRLGRAVSSHVVGSEPNTIAVGLGAVWVANSGDGTVSRIDPHFGAVHTIAAVGRHPSGIAVGPDSVWVASFGDRTVARIDPRADRVTRRIRVRRSTQAIAVGSGAVWVTNSVENTVSRIDSRSNRVVKVIAVGHGPKGIAVAPSGIWVANSGDGTVSRIDPGSNKLLDRAIKLGGQPNAIAAGLGAVWVTNLYDSTVTPITP